MKIQSTQQYVNFGQKVPTEYLLKAALKKISYTEAKELNYSAGVKYSGHIGFYKRAFALAEKACNQDETLKQTVEKLTQIANEKEQVKEIQRIASFGEMTDVII